jgi:hypothetical protein
MATHSEHDQAPVDNGVPPHEASSEGGETSNQTPSHGSSGEGSSSAMAKLISQEQARIVPGTPDDEPTGSS